MFHLPPFVFIPFNDIHVSRTYFRDLTVVTLACDLVKQLMWFLVFLDLLKNWILVGLLM